MAQSPLLIVGMARSGTSLAAQALTKLGFSPGRTELLISGDEDNPDGYFELAELTFLNDKIREALGMSANPALSIPKDWEDFEGIKPLVEKVALAIKSSFKAGDTWLLKDPRISLLLPIYKSIVSNPNFLICVRNPYDSARSFNKKFQVPEQFCKGMWLHHTLSALHETVGFPSRFVLYESLLTDLKGALEPVLELYPQLVPTDMDWQNASNVVRSNLNHAASQANGQELRPYLIAETYSLCKLAAANPALINTADFEAKVSQLWEEFEAWWSMNPAEMALFTRVQLSWKEDGSIKQESFSYVPNLRRSTATIQIKATEGVQVFVSLSHLPGNFLIHSIGVQDASGSVLPVEFRISREVRVENRPKGDHWSIPCDGNHFMFTVPKRASTLTISISSTVSVSEMAQIARSNWVALLAERQKKK